MIKQIVTKRLRAILACMALFVVAACGQKGPLEPQPLPDKNEPSNKTSQPKADGQATS